MIVLYVGIAIVLLFVIYKFHRSHVELHNRFKQILEVERIRQDIERGREEAMKQMVYDNVDLRKRVERLEDGKETEIRINQEHDFMSLPNEF